jgi:cytoskeletal protein CcmA (bactofilin family)
LSDKEGILDGYDTVHINCGTFIATPEVNAKLGGKNAQINAGTTRIREITGKILQLDAGAVIDGNADYKGLFIIAAGDLIARGEGAAKLGVAEGVIVTGTLYYPESSNAAALAKVSGNKQSYPDGAELLLGDYTLEKALAAVPKDRKHIWAPGKITALNRKTLEEAKASNRRIGCASLFINERLNDTYGDLFDCPDRALVPDGYEVSGNLESAELPLYGPRIYVDGNFSMEEKDLPLLEAIESIVVKGKARLPASTVQMFRKKGRADDYEVFEGRLVVINGFTQFGRGRLAEAAGGKITLLVNGCLVFDDDLGAEDVAGIAALSYNGVVLAPAAVNAALAPKVKEANGFMGDPATIEKLTGKSLRELAAAYMGGHDDGSRSINTGTYLLI